jgi:hypothetical protein
MRSGYVALDCGVANVNAFVTYSLYSGTPGGRGGGGGPSSAVKVGEATVFSSPSARALVLLNDDRDDSRLGVAIANDTNASSQVEVRLGDFYGQIIASRTLTIAPKSSIAAFLSELVPGSPAVHVGQVLFDSSSEINVIGLKFTGPVFTTIPSVVRNQ